MYSCAVNPTIQLYTPENYDVVATVLQSTFSELIVFINSLPTSSLTASTSTAAVSPLKNETVPQKVLTFLELCGERMSSLLVFSIRLLFLGKNAKVKKIVFINGIRLYQQNSCFFVHPSSLLFIVKKKPIK